MSENRIKKALEELPERGSEMLDSNISYYKLFVFRFIAKSAYGLITIFIWGMTGLLILFFLSFAMAFALGGWLGNVALGFTLVGLFYFLLICFASLFRKKLIEKPLLSKLSEAYFKSEDDDEK